MARPKLPTYTDDQIRARLEGLPGWYHEDGWLRRQYKTDGWPTTLMLVNQIGFLSEVALWRPVADTALEGTPNKFVMSGKAGG